MRFSFSLLGFTIVLGLLLVSAICFADTVPFYAEGNVMSAASYNHKVGSSDMTLIIRLVADGQVVIDENYDVKYFVAYADEPDPNNALGDSWIAPGFDDSAWEDGKSGVGYADGDDNTEVETKKDATGDEQISAIFTRYRFRLDGKPASVELLMDYDDACIIWINGVEAGRANMGGADEAGIPPWDVGNDGVEGSELIDL